MNLKITRVTGRLLDNENELWEISDGFACLRYGRSEAEAKALVAEMEEAEAKRQAWLAELRRTACKKSISTDEQSV